MDKTIAIQVILWWLLLQVGGWGVRQFLGKTVGTRYQTEASCKASRDECRRVRETQRNNVHGELKSIRVLLMKVAIKQGVQVEDLGEVIQ